MFLDLAHRRAALFVAPTLALALAVTGTAVAAPPGGGPSPAPAAPVPQAPPELDAVVPGLERIALFAEEGMSIQRAARIENGSVLVRGGASSTPWPARAALEIERDVRVTGPDVLVAADSLVLGRGAVVANAAFDEGVLDGRVEGEVITPSPPLEVPAPNLPEPGAGTDDVRVRAGTSTTLDAGRYRDLQVDRGGSVVLAGGDYGFRSITIARDAELSVAAGAHVVVSERVVVGRDSRVGLAPAGKVGVEPLTIVAWGEPTGGPVAGPALEIGRDSLVAAWLHAPSGAIVVDRDARVRGTMAARWISLARDVQVSFAPEPLRDDDGYAGVLDPGGRRLEVARDLGVVSAADHARFAVARWFDPDRVPEEFRADEEARPADLTVALTAAMRDFETLDTAVQEEIYGYFAPGPMPQLPLAPLTDEELGPEVAMVDPSFFPRGGAGAGAAAAAGAPAGRSLMSPQADDSTDDEEEADDDDEEEEGRGASLGSLECRDSGVYLVTLPPFAYRCKYSTSVADFFFSDADLVIAGNTIISGSVEPTDELDYRLGEGANGVPDAIDAVAAALIHARNDYRAMGYDPIPKITVTISHVQGGFSMPHLGLMHLNANSLVYLTRHELFHQFQYAYANTTWIGLDYSGLTQTTTAWWLEATAEWAAHKAQQRTRPFVSKAPWFTRDKGKYAWGLADFFWEPTAPLTQFVTPLQTTFSSSVRTPQYGSFVFAEHLVKQLDESVILSSWEHIRLGARPIHGVETAIRERGADVGDILRSFHRANYMIERSYESSDLVTWMSYLGALDGRPLRRLTGARDGQVVPGRGVVEAGGALYLEATLPSGDPARTASFDIDLPSRSVLDVNHLRTDGGVAECSSGEDTEWVVSEPRVHEATFTLTPECPTVVVVVSHVMPDPPAGAREYELTWTVAFADVEEEDGSDPPPDGPDPDPEVPDLVATGLVHERFDDELRQEFVRIDVLRAPAAAARDESGIAVSCETDIPVAGRDPSSTVLFRDGSDPAWRAEWFEAPREGDGLVDVPFVGRTYTCTIDAVDESGLVLASTELTILDDSPTRATVDWDHPSNRLEAVVLEVPRAARSFELTCVAIAYLAGSNSPDEGVVGQAFSTGEPVPEEWRDTAYLPVHVTVDGPASYRFSCTLDFYDHIDWTSPDANVIATSTGTREIGGLIS